MYKRNNMKVIIGAFIGLGSILLVTLIYAAFTGQLNISGTAVGRESKWEVHFENVSSITTSGTAKVLSNHQPTINPNNRTQIQDYEVSLTSPADSISFTFDVVNDGNYNAKITSVSVGTPQCTSTDTTSATNMCNNLTYTLKYSSGATINQNSDIVYAKDKVTMKVTLTFDDISDASLLPTAGVSINNLGIQINFEQEGNALVNETTGEVANNRVYHQGEKITLNNEDYWVITNSGAGQDYVVALKNIPLSGTVVYGAHNYDDSNIKTTVDDWAIATFSNGELKEVDGYSARLITKDEYTVIPITESWRGSTYRYWTMTPQTDPQNYFVEPNGNLDYMSYSHSLLVRPVINVYKSALETNNKKNKINKIIFDFVFI